jgi:acetoin utilization deacetylase AcuC-like enzyme
MTELVMVEQRQGEGDDAFWVREGDRKIKGQDGNRRLVELRAGLVRHSRVRAVVADAADEEVERTLAALHEAEYLQALEELSSEEPVVMPQFAPPGLEPDIPVNANLVAAAREGIRTAITAAERLLEGARYTYAVCRPPGHHAGPAFHAGYCYLNNAAAAVRTLLDGGLAPVGVLDLDLHYPNGTAAIVAPITEARLHSLHAWPVTNVATQTVKPRSPRERAVEFEGSPDADAYLEAVAASIEALAASSAALVISLGYDTVKGDPHGGWDFAPPIFAQIGRLLAASERPVCVIQEGGYALATLAACSYAFAAGLLDARRPGVEGAASATGARANRWSAEGSWAA